MQSELEKLLELGGRSPTERPPHRSAAAPAGAAPAPAGAPDRRRRATLTVRHVGDRFGYRWILVEGGDIDDLVTRVHMVHSSLEDAGWSAQLLCSVFGFAPDPADRRGGGPTPVHAAHLPRLPGQAGHLLPVRPHRRARQRDTELELRIRGVLGTDLPVESDLSRWFPMWDLPVA